MFNSAMSLNIKKTKPIPYKYIYIYKKLIINLFNCQNAKNYKISRCEMAHRAAASKLLIKLLSPRLDE